MHTCWPVPQFMSSVRKDYKDMWHETGYRIPLVIRYDAVTRSDLALQDLIALCCTPRRQERDVGCRGQMVPVGHR